MLQQELNRAIAKAGLPDTRQHKKAIQCTLKTRSMNTKPPEKTGI